MDIVTHTMMLAIVIIGAGVLIAFLLNTLADRDDEIEELEYDVDYLIEENERLQKLLIVTNTVFMN